MPRTFVCRMRTFHSIQDEGFIHYTKIGRPWIFNLQGCVGARESRAKASQSFLRFELTTFAKKKINKKKKKKREKEKRNHSRVSRNEQCLPAAAISHRCELYLYEGESRCFLFAPPVQSILAGSNKGMSYTNQRANDGLSGNMLLAVPHCCPN